MPANLLICTTPDETVWCRTCGARYRVSYDRAPLPVMDSFNCQICRSELASWSGYVVPRHLLETEEFPRDPAPASRGGRRPTGTDLSLERSPSPKKRAGW